MTKDQVRQNDREHNAVWPPRGRLPGWYYRALRRRRARQRRDELRLRHYYPNAGDQDGSLPNP